MPPSQGRRDDNKTKICVFEWGDWGAERKIVQKRFFLGKLHDNKKKNSKVQISLLRSFVVIAQAPTLLAESGVHTTNLYHDTPPICTAIPLQKHKGQGMSEHPQSVTGAELMQLVPCLAQEDL